MSRRKFKPPRNGLRDLGWRVLSAGAGIAAFALVLSTHKWFSGVSGAVLPFALLLACIGGVILWTTRTRAPSETPLSKDPERPDRRIEPRMDQVVDRTPTELSRLVAGATDHKVGSGAPQEWSTDVFDVIEWRRFEAVVERLFQQAGFQTKAQSHGADGGVDIWLYSRNQSDAPASLVQCKHWSGKRIGVDKVRELRGVMAAHQVTRGQFATTSSFTAEAIEFAKSNGINLLDVNRLLSLIRQRSVDQQRELLQVALEGEYWRPTCVNCGVKMVERTPKAGGAPFWGCVLFPRCRTTMPMRAVTRPSSL